MDVDTVMNVVPISNYNNINVFTAIIVRQLGVRDYFLFNVSVEE